MKIFLCFFSLLFILVVPVHAEATLEFSKIKNTREQSAGSEILKVAYKKIGISIEIVEMPGKRSLQEANQGNVDGEVNRIWEIAKEYPNLIRVPTPINYIESSAFSKNFDFLVTGCDDLKNYSIGIVRGSKYAELCTKGMDQVYVMNSLDKAMILLDRDRIDFVITAKHNGLYIIEKQGLSSIHILSPALKRRNLYHYLNKKNKSLVSKIDKVLSEMQENGEMALLHEKYQ